jgi:hypothetical protein
MTVTARRLNRATLGRQLILRREPVSVVDAVRRVVALQAQEPPSPYLALWNRSRPSTPPTSTGPSSTMRHQATLMHRAARRGRWTTSSTTRAPTLRAHAWATAFTVAGLSIADDASSPVLRLAEPRTNAAVEAWPTAAQCCPGRAWWRWYVRFVSPARHQQALVVRHGRRTSPLATSDAWATRSRPATLVRYLEIQSGLGQTSPVRAGAASRRATPCSRWPTSSDTTPTAPLTSRVAAARDTPVPPRLLAM